MAIRSSFYGSLGRDSEVKAVGDNKVTKFSVANNTGYGDKKKTIWIDCDAWGSRYEKLAQYLLKGQSVLVYGEIEINEYKAKDGTMKASMKCRVTDIELVGSKKDNGGGKSEEAASYTAPAADFDDSIPF